MDKRPLTMLLLASVLLTGCQSEVKPESRPAWVDSPGDNFVGKCATHVRGLIAQEQCAYKKGLTYMAMSKGVSIDVSSNMTMKQSATQAAGSSHGSNFGQLEATVKMDEKDIRVSGTIIDKWHDKVTDIMYVLIEEN